MFEVEFTKVHSAMEKALADAAVFRRGFDTREAADDALRVLENHMNKLDEAVIAILKTIRERA